MAQPSSTSPFLASMEKKKPKELLRDKGGYCLEHSLRERMTAKYGQRKITVQVTKMLTDLPARVPDVAEREFLDEALICYRSGAFRAAIVMTWNLAFDHLLNFILKHHLAGFNKQWPISYAKRRAKPGFLPFRAAKLMRPLSVTPALPLRRRSCCRLLWSRRR
jgi:hypothetical protein